MADSNRWRDHREHLVMAESLALREIDVRYRRVEKKLSAMEARRVALKEEFDKLKLNTPHRS